MHVAKITTCIIRDIEAPRSQLGEFIKPRKRSRLACVFCWTSCQCRVFTHLYIGQSGCACTRLVQYNQSMDFSNQVLVVISLTNRITQTHAVSGMVYDFRGHQGETLQPGRTATPARTPTCRPRWGRTATKFTKPPPLC